MKCTKCGKECKSTLEINKDGERNVSLCCKADIMFNEVFKEKTNNGGPAFPEIRIKQTGDPCYNSPTKVYYKGMSLRDYFAAKVLNGICSNPGYNKEYPKKNVVELCYEMADAMLEARKK